MNFKLKIWRQADAKAKGGFETYEVNDISEDTSFLEMLDILNNNLIHEGKEPVAFDHDCREGICGMCSLHINGEAHGPDTEVTTCQLHMRKFHDGDTITIEPWRSAAFPVIKDLVVERSAFDKIMQAGGFISVNTGGVPDANTIPVPRTCRGELELPLASVAVLRGYLQKRFGHAVRSGPRFVAGQAAAGKVETLRRAKAMIAKMDELGFGGCTNTRACEAECPKSISISHIARLNRKFLTAKFKD